jgi:hypothetical protein
MTKNELAKGLANSIKAGIEKYQNTLKKTIEKENKGLEKLHKTIGQVDPGVSGAGTLAGANTPMVSVPTIMKNAMPGGEAGGSVVSSSMSSPDNSDGLKASEKEMCKDEFVNKALSCPACGGPSEPLMELDGLMHSLCKNCGLPAAHPTDSGLIKKSVTPVIPAVSSAKPSGASIRGTAAHLIPGTQAYKQRMAKEDAAKGKRLAADAPKLSHSPMPISVPSTIPGKTPPKVSVVDKILSRKELDKGELEKVTPPGEEKLVHKLKDEYGTDKEGKGKAYATAWKIHNEKNVEKKEIEIPVGTVGIKANEGAKLPPKKLKEIKAPGSGGQITRVGDLNKGAIADMVAQARQKYGLSGQKLPGSGVPNLPEKSNGKAYSKEKPMTNPPIGNKINKADFPAAKAVTKSPSSAPAGKTGAPAPAMVPEKKPAL